MLSGPCSCPPVLAGNIGYTLPCLLELEVYTRCFVDDLWYLGRVFHPGVPNPSLCIVYTDHISHPSACPIYGDVTRTEMFPSLSEEDAVTPSTGSACRGASRPLPSGPHLGEQIEPVGSSEKWETVASEQWMQKTTWNRMVTRTRREPPHTTPVTTTWTTDFLTREGEGRKAMGDWLHDKLIPWKTRRRLLQTNSGTFPCESRLHKWGKHSDGICGLCK